MNCHGLWCPRERHGKWAWAPPPGAADYALEQLRLARLKRVKSTLVFVCPRLLVPQWRRQLHRVADCVFECPAGTEFWPSNRHEPLVFGICFPFISHRPWQLRQSPAILEVARAVQRMWKTQTRCPGPVLQQLCTSAWSLGSLPADVVWSVLQGSRVLFFSHRGTRKRRRSSVEEEA